MANPWSHIETLLSAGDVQDAASLQRLLESCRMSIHGNDSELPLHAFLSACSSFSANGVDVYGALLPAILNEAIRAARKEITFPAILDAAGEVRVPLAQCRAFLALAFFGVLPDYDCNAPCIDLVHLYASSRPVAVARVQCLLEYFRRTLVIGYEPEGELVVQRVQLPTTTPDWERCDAVLRGSDLEIVPVCIEDTNARTHLDFANKRLHLGRMCASATQEEILFSIRPGLLVAMLIVGATPLKANEAVIIDGARRYSRYSGYSSSFQYAGPYEPESEPPSILAIDALVAHKEIAQFEQSAVIRDFNKAWLGFSVSSGPIATGLWGCGAFGGDPALKLLQQWAAASLANKQLIFCTAGNADMLERTKRLCDLLDGLTIQKGWQLISEYAVSLRKDKPDNQNEGIAREIWEEAGELEQAGLMSQAVALYKRALRLWQSIDRQATSVHDYLECRSKHLAVSSFERFLLCTVQK